MSAAATSFHRTNPGPTLPDYRPTCRHGQKIGNAEPDVKRRLTYAALAWTLSEVAGRLELWTQGLEGWAMTESTLWRQIRNKEKADSILFILRTRFKAEPPPEVKTAVEAVSDAALLQTWMGLAATEPTLDAFRQSAGI